jgi:hypothetical protein
LRDDGCLSCAVLVVCCLLWCWCYWLQKARPPDPTTVLFRSAIDRSLVVHGAGCDGLAWRSSSSNAVQLTACPTAIRVLTISTVCFVLLLRCCALFNNNDVQIVESVLDRTDSIAVALLLGYGAYKFSTQYVSSLASAFIKFCALC